MKDLQGYVEQEATPIKRLMETKVEFQKYCIIPTYFYNIQAQTQFLPAKMF